jgi:hypothetical protein
LESVEANNGQNGQVVKRKTNRPRKYKKFAEIESEQTLGGEDSSLARAPSFKLDALLTFYNSFVKTDPKDTSIHALVCDLNKLLQSSVKELSEEKASGLQSRFETIVRDHFDEWRLMRARSRPAVWSVLPSTMIVNVILWKIEN